MIPPIVDAAWLREHRDGVVVADVRWYADGRSGVDAHAAGHIDGAVFVDLDRVLSGPPSAAEGRHPLPEPAAFAEAMGRLGIGDGDTVVGYDDARGVIAARLVWMLRAIGHPAALLDGGLVAWDGPISRGPSSRPPVTFTPCPWPSELLASADDVAGMASGVLLDARSRKRYRGEPDPLDPRYGHIPGARSLPCTGNLDSSGRLLPVDELRARFRSVGVDETTPVISSCGSGVTACHTLLAMEVAGFGRGRLYPGSWSQWGADEARPMATGDDAG